MTIFRLKAKQVITYLISVEADSLEDAITQMDGMAVDCDTHTGDFESEIIDWGAPEYLYWVEPLTNK